MKTTRNIIFPLDRAVQRFDAIALEDDKQSLSWQDLNNEINQYCHFIENEKTFQNELIALEMHNSINTIIFIWALWKMQKIVVLINPLETNISVEAFLKDINCQVIVTSTLKINFKSTKNITQYKLANIILRSVQFKQPPFVLNKIATIMQSSGSSGRPKLIYHTFANHYWNARGSNANILFKIKDQWLLSLPMHHVSGLSLLWKSVRSGGSLFISKKESEALISRQNISHVSFVPTQLKRYLDSTKMQKRLSKLKCILVGGARLNSELAMLALEKRINLYYSYGMSEMASQICTEEVTKQSIQNGLVSVGKRLLYRRINIVKNEELIVGGACLCHKIVSNAKTLIYNSNSMMKTNDCASFIDGNLFIKGRIDNMIISGGENIFPEEIESVLLDLNMISSACVVSIKENHWGECLVAFVIFEKSNNNFNILIEKLKTSLTATLPKYKIPKHFFEMPTMKTLKVQRKLLHEKALELINKQ